MNCLTKLVNGWSGMVTKCSGWKPNLWIERNEKGVGYKKNLKKLKLTTLILDMNYFIEMTKYWHKVDLIYRVPHLKPYNSRRLFFYLTNKFLMVKISFSILQIWPFYNISSFFDLCKTLFHKSVFFKKNFFFNIFFKNIFFASYES